MRFFVGTIIVCLLGSCASVNKGVFIKRKYNKGYYVSNTSHKRSASVKENNPDNYRKALPELKNETPEIAIVEKRDLKQFINSISEVEKPKQKPSFSLSNNKPRSFSTSTQSQHKALDLKKNVKEKLSFQIQKQRRSISDTQIGVGLILFLLLTIIYTFALVLHNPTFPIFLAIPIAMIGALLTLLTGVLFI